MSNELLILQLFFFLLISREAEKQIEKFSVPSRPVK